MAQSEFVGVDACSGGWFSVGMIGNDDYELKGFFAFEELVNYYGEAQLILVDMPIGLPTGQKDVPVGDNPDEIGGRRCDWEARKLLGCRKKSVFPTLTRCAVHKGWEAKQQAMQQGKKRGYAHSYACKVALRYERKTSGAEFDKKSFNLVDKIHEVDSLLPLQTLKVREVHPEICFWALNDEQPMASKHGKRGIEQRINALNRVGLNAEEILNKSLRKYPNGQVGKDDVLDALVAAVTAYRGHDDLKMVPGSGCKDDKNLTMEMVYWKP